MCDHFRQSRQASYRGVEPVRRAVNGAIPLAGKRHHLRLELARACGTRTSSCNRAWPLSSQGSDRSYGPAIRGDIAYRTNLYLNRAPSASMSPVVGCGKWFAEDVDFAVENLTFVDIHYRFSPRVQDGPERPAVYAARHIGGYADIIITRLYEERSRAAGFSLDLVDNREVVVHLG